MIAFSTCPQAYQQKLGITFKGFEFEEFGNAYYFKYYGFIANFIDGWVCDITATNWK